MRVAILQPNYLPWLGVFYQIYKNDIFVFYDDVPYDKGGWRNRNKIKTPKGEQWLTVPVLTKGKFGDLIYRIEINNTVNWRKKHLIALKTNYSHSPFYNKYLEYFEDIYSQEWNFIKDIDIKIIKDITSMLGIQADFVCSSDLNIDGENANKTERLIRVLKKLSATHYMASNASKDYLNESLFKENGIELSYHNYKHPTYSQMYGGFISHLSILDLLFNCGDKSLEILLSEME